MSVYELDKKLDKNRYTNINPEEYYNKYDPKSLLGRKAYSAFDTSVPDSVRFEKDNNGYYTFYPNVTFPLDKKNFRRRQNIEGFIASIPNTLKTPQLS